MTDTELLPCPFCGGAAKLFHDTSSDDERNWVFVVECADWTCTDARKTKAEAIAAWNRRTANVIPAIGNVE